MTRDLFGPQRAGSTAILSIRTSISQYLRFAKYNSVTLNVVSTTRPFTRETPSSSAVTDLRFTDWHPQDVSLLASVLPSIRHWKHFMIDVRGRWMYHPVTVPMYELPPHDHGLLLQPHNASLEELVIAYSNEAYSDLMHFPPKASPVMGTLTNYHS